MPSRAAGDEGIDRAAYYTSLDGTYRHGLVEAVKFILRGALGHAFFPSSPELRMQHDKCMAHHRDMRARIQRREQIAAERPAPVERTEAQIARVRALYADFCKGHAAAREGENQEAEREMVRRRYGMSPEALASIKDQPLARTRMGNTP